MPISEVVKSWCVESNARTGANRWFAAFLAVIVACVGGVLFAEGYARLSVLVAVLTLFAWPAFAPRAVTLGKLRGGSYRDSSIPDSLLAKIADSGDVPESIKSELADKLKMDGQVSFGQLFELEGRLVTEAERAKIEKGSGYRKMMAFRGGNGE